MATFKPKESVSLDELVDMVDVAYMEWLALCASPRRRIRTSVPPQDDDTDIVIGEALRHARMFFVEVQQRLRGGDRVETDTEQEIAPDAPEAASGDAPVPTEKTEEATSDALGG